MVLSLKSEGVLLLLTLVQIGIGLPTTELVIFKGVERVGEYRNWLKLIRPTWMSLTHLQLSASKQHVLLHIPELLFLPIAAFLDHVWMLRSKSRDHL